MKDFPVIRLILFFIAGIISQSYLHISIEQDFIILGISIVTFIVSYAIEKRSYSFGLTSVIILLIAAILGYTSENIQQKMIKLVPDSLYVVNNFTASGRIEKINLPERDGFSFLIRTDSVEVPDKIEPGIILLCRVWENENAELYDSIRPGYRVQVTGTYRKGREKRNPGEFDYNKYLHSQNISGILSIYDKKNLSVKSSEPDRFQNAIFSARKSIDKIITKVHDPQTSALLKSLILADRNDLDPEIKNQFINAGVVHILAVSGLHVGFIALIFYTLLGRLNLFLRSFLTITGILLFMLITGIPPSVFRASVMGIIIILAFLLNRTTNIYNSLAIAALIILAIDPSDIFNPGFQLSFSAVISIAYFYPVLNRLINKAAIKNHSLKGLLLFCAVSISAQIGTLPLTLNYFGKISLVAVLANLFVIPLAGIIIGTAVITLALFPISSLIASIYASANDFFAYLLFKIVELSGTFKYSVINVRDYSSWDTFIFYFFILAGIFLSGYLNSVKAKVILILLVAANILIYTAGINSELLSDNNLNVYMIDVGQGDSFLITFPDGETALIDAGNATPYFDNGERVILPLLNYLGIGQIDYGFVSHIDADHYGGYISLIEKEKIKKIYKPLPDTSFEKDMRFEKYLKGKDIPTEYYTQKEIRIGNAVIFILNDINHNWQNSNDKSGIIKVEYGKTSILFTGDLGENGENYYLNKYMNFLDVDILKVGHHGSKTGSSDEFLKTASPQISLISCGIKNKFGHPSDAVISRLGMNDSHIYRTDKERGILLQSDGIRIEKIDWENYY